VLTALETPLCRLPAPPDLWFLCLRVHPSALQWDEWIAFRDINRRVAPSGTFTRGTALFGADAARAVNSASTKYRLTMRDVHNVRSVARTPAPCVLNLQGLV
jgi:hypothetical protein